MAIYESTGQGFTDTKLDNAKNYYYAIYAYDRKPNYSQPVIISARPEATKIAVSPQSSVSSQPTKITGSTLRITGPFKFGAQSEQVKILQQMLSQDKIIYPEGIVTGYYGKLTVKAVQKFQCQYGIICAGTPETTGYGIAGPKTREKINSVYGNSQSSTVSSQPSAVSVPAGQSSAQSLQDQIKAIQDMLLELNKSLQAEKAKR